jgi:hypothetical protein
VTPRHRTTEKPAAAHPLMPKDPVLVLSIIAMTIIIMWMIAAILPV